MEDALDEMDMTICYFFLRSLEVLQNTECNGNFVLNKFERTETWVIDCQTYWMPIIIFFTKNLFRSCQFNYHHSVKCFSQFRHLSRKKRTHMFAINFTSIPTNEFQLRINSFEYNIHGSKLTSWRPCYFLLIAFDWTRHFPISTRTNELRPAHTCRKQMYESPLRVDFNGTTSSRRLRLYNIIHLWMLISTRIRSLIVTLPANRHWFWETQLRDTARTNWNAFRNQNDWYSNRICYSSYHFSYIYSHIFAWFLFFSLNYPWKLGWQSQQFDSRKIGKY